MSWSPRPRRSVVRARRSVEFSPWMSGSRMGCALSSIFCDHSLLQGLQTSLTRRFGRNVFPLLNFNLSSANLRLPGLLTALGVREQVPNPFCEDVFSTTCVAADLGPAQSAFRHARYPPSRWLRTTPKGSLRLPSRRNPKVPTRRPASLTSRWRFRSLNGATSSSCSSERSAVPQDEPDKDQGDQLAPETHRQ